MSLPFDPAEVPHRLLAWYCNSGRDLPWRNSRDPYRIWLSEIMLQQTTVAVVIPYFERFLQRFPTLAALASASLDDIVTLWAGLGYYSRARNLHQAARQIVAERKGVFPDTLESLLMLPGVGRSTAGAILSIAFDKPVPILDGNVRRVLVRLFAWLEDPRGSRADKQLWQWAGALTSTDSPHDYAQAIMDLGATVCTPRDPDCAHCPLQEICQAYKEGLVAVLPVVRKKQKVTVRQQVVLIVHSSSGLLIRQRPQEGFLGGLWEFPTVDLCAGQKPELAASSLLIDLGLHGTICKAGAVKHAYSHFKLELTVFSVAAGPVETVAELDAYCWCDENTLGNSPLHGAHKKAYSKVASER